VLTRVSRELFVGKIIAESVDASVFELELGGRLADIGWPWASARVSSG
jgi:hypothetical protein